MWRSAPGARGSDAVKRVAVACLVTATLANAAHAGANSCNAAAEHLTSLVKTNWPSSDQNTPGAAGDMIGTFLHKSPTGFVAGTARLKLAEYSRQAFVEQAAQLKNPFTLSKELLDALDDMQGGLTVYDVPGTGLFAATSIAGTAYCNATIFFSVENGRANLAPQPESWENDVGDGCGLTRSFASVDGVPVVIDDSLSAGPRLTATLTLTPWGNGKWLDPCEADFAFAPYFDPDKTLNDWAKLDNWQDNDCGSGGCEAFRRAALGLVRQTQQDRDGVERNLLAGMTAPQREEYQRLKRASGRPDPDVYEAEGNVAGALETAAGLTDTSPLPLPMVVDNRVFLATVGHFTIGWRTFADWKVTVESGEADKTRSDKTREIARFAIGMTQGPIVGVSIK